MVENNLLRSPFRVIREARLIHLRFDVLWDDRGWRGIRNDLRLVSVRICAGNSEAHKWHIGVYELINDSPNLLRFR